MGNLYSLLSLRIPLTVKIYFHRKARYSKCLMADRNQDIYKLLFAEFRTNGYRYRTFENWLIHEVMRLREPEEKIRADERGRVLAEIEKWILRQVGDKPGEV